MVPPVSQPGRRLALISIASLGWAFSFGLGAPLAALWLKQAGASGWTIGLNTSVYYLAVALTAPILPRLMRRHNRSCIVAGMLIDALTTAAFSWVSGDLAWHGLRFVGGIGTALSLIPMETLVNHNAPTDRRARDFGVYAFCVALGIGLGSLVGLLLYPYAPHLAFAVGGFVTLAAVVPAWLGAPTTCRPEPCAGGDALPWRAGLLLGFGTAWVQGFIEGGSITFLSIYLLSLGYHEAATSGLMGALFAGVVLAQLPLACLADRVGRLRVVLVCHALLLAGLVCAPWVPWTGFLVGLLFVVGAANGAMYPLGLALLGERIPPSAMARANAWYLACNCGGSLLGPILIGVSIDAFGILAFFVVCASAIVLVVGVWLALGRGGSPARAASPARRAA